MRQGVVASATHARTEEQIDASPVVPKPVNDGGIIAIARYRKLTADYTSTDARALERLRYLEQFCRVIIQTELDNYAKKTRNKIPGHV